MLRTSHGLLCALKSLRSMLRAPGGKSFTFTFTFTEVFFPTPLEHREGSLRD